MNNNITNSCSYITGTEVKKYFLLAVSAVGYNLDSYLMCAGDS